MLTIGLHRSGLLSGWEEATRSVRLPHNALIRRAAGCDPCNASRLMLMQVLMEVDEDNTIF